MSQLTSYREALCTADNKGRALFSPLCNPNYRPPAGVTGGHVESKDISIDQSCRVKPVEQRKAQVSQFDDAESAFDWFKDPTYAQRVAMRKKGVDDAVADVNPSIVLYHKLKTMERLGGSLLQSM